MKVNKIMYLMIFAIITFDLVYLVFFSRAFIRNFDLTYDMLIHYVLDPVLFFLIAYCLADTFVFNELKIRVYNKVNKKLNFLIKLIIVILIVIYCIKLILTFCFGSTSLAMLDFIHFAMRKKPIFFTFGFLMALLKNQKT